MQGKLLLIVQVNVSLAPKAVLQLAREVAISR